MSRRGDDAWNRCDECGKLLATAQTVKRGCSKYEVNDYAISTYGSELAGDCLNCMNCGEPWGEHRDDAPQKGDGE